MEKVNSKDLLIRELKRDIEELRREVAQLTNERDLAQYCLEETRKSFSYRLGLALTSLPRKIRNRKG